MIVGIASIWRIFRAATRQRFEVRANLIGILYAGI
jgi:hypothetical protein